MNRYKIFEQYKQYEALEQFKAISDPTLRTAAASGCFPKGYQINVKHPETGQETIYAQSLKPENSNNKHVFYKPDGTLDYRTTADATGKTIRTIKWTCYSLLERTNPEVSKVQKELLDALEKNLGWKKNEDVKSSDILSYDLTDVATDPDLKPGGLYYNVVKGVQQYMDDLVSSNRPFLMWKPKKKGIDPKKRDEEQKRILELFPGYEICSYADSEKSNFIQINIDEKYPDFFENGTKLCKPISALSNKEKSENLLKLVGEIEKKPKRKNCKNLISIYYDVTQKKTPISQNEIDQIKPWVKLCSTQFNFPFLKKEIQDMQRIKIKGLNNQVLDFSLLESKQDNIKTIVSESLIKLKEQKNRKVIFERKEVAKRLNVIFESIEIKNRRDVKILSDYLLGEMIRLRNDGYSEELIGEQLELLKFFTGGGKGGDLLSTLKGSAGSGIMSMVIETIANGLLKSMGIPSDGVLGTLIVKTISNLTPADLPKLTDCRFVSGLITKSILETIAAEVTKGIGGKSMIGSFIENTLFELSEESDVFQSIKNFVGDKIVCPYLEGKGENVLSDLFKGD